jgi:copper chaperone CopZ
MNKACLKIEGMHCEGCAKRLENILNRKENIEATVSFEKKEANIEYKDLTIKEIEEIIEDAGFTSLGEIV